MKFSYKLLVERCFLSPKLPNAVVLLSQCAIRSVDGLVQLLNSTLNVTFGLFDSGGFIRDTAPGRFTLAERAALRGIVRQRLDFGSAKRARDEFDPFEHRLKLIPFGPTSRERSSIRLSKRLVFDPILKLYHNPFLFAESRGHVAELLTQVIREMRVHLELISDYSSLVFRLFSFLWVLPISSRICCSVPKPSRSRN